MCAAVALVSALLLPEPALAAPREAQRATAAMATAQALFEQGRALMAQGRPRAACPKFEESQRLDAALGTQLNLANCYEQLGRLASAYTLFSQVAANARAAGQAQRAELAQARADALQPKLTKLVIVVPAGSGEVRVEHDGRPVREAQWGVPVPVDPGSQRVRAFGPELGEWTQVIDVPSDGGVHQVTIPGELEPGLLSPLHRKLAVAAGGVGIAGVAMGTYFSLRAVAQKNEADELGCRGKQCPTPRGVQLRESATSAGNLATIGVGVGVAGLTAAALLWMVPELGADDARERQAAGLQLVPVLTRAGPGLFVSARY